MGKRRPLVWQIMKEVNHRPWTLPSGPWVYYQEWNRALFLHWRVPKELLQPLIPAGTSLEIFDGDAWISIVAFTMEEIRPRQLPALSFISTFHEINVRTYITSAGKSGVYFLNIEAGKLHSAWTARLLSGLPYEYANIQRYTTKDEHRYSSINKTKGFQLEAIFGVGEPIQTKSPLDIFLTEKYCLYLGKANRLYRYDVQHLPWNLYHVKTIQLKTSYHIRGISLDRSPDLVHYSEGVQVLAWKRKEI
jgi:uncharacterized protein YqjF (DUF2071 family)